jgi:hypothetical protein
MPKKRERRVYVPNPEFKRMTRRQKTKQLTI